MISGGREYLLDGRGRNDGPSSMAKVQGPEVQGGGYGGGRGSGDGTTNDASDESRRLALKALVADGVRQCRERPANESSDSPEPPKPPDDPAPRRTESLSVKLKAERRVATSCDVECTRAQTDASGAPGYDQDDRKRPMKLQTTSGCVNERSKAKGCEDSPMAGRVEQNDPGGKADASGMPEDDEDDWDMPTKLRNTSEHVNESSKRRSRKYSPCRPGGEPDEPGAETAVSGDIHDLQKRPRTVSNEHVDETDAPRRDKGRRGHMGELERPRSVKGDWDRQTDVEDVGYDQKQGKMDGTTSGTRSDSKRVAPRPIAEGQPSKHERYERKPVNVPRTSTPSRKYSRRPIHQSNPLRRRGRLKLRSRKISREDLKRTTYRVVQRRRGHIRHIGRV